ncbi:MAG: homocysteine S-methyltransferase family protein [Deltaproteobacteria bacterium]|nr:homocysteine S-methyltransferase family protein [Deltaproteobacteria bacterium]
MKSLLEQLKEKILLMDGAMGTILQSRGLPVGTPSALWTLERPEEVKKVHQEYVSAGAEVIFTNTFTASRKYIESSKIPPGPPLSKGGKQKLPPLEKGGGGGFVREINHTAVQLARETAGDKGWVAGSVGPAGNAENYREQIEVLAQAGVDLIALETMTNQKETEIAVKAAKSYIINDKTPLMVSMTVNERGLLPSNEDPLLIIPFLEKNGATIIGLNCSEGPESIYPVFKKMQKQTQLPISIKPNTICNSPHPPLKLRGGERGSYSDDEFVQWAKRFIDEGANLIGGCCGTTPETIRQMAKALSPNFQQAVW